MTENAKCSLGTPGTVLIQKLPRVRELQKSEAHFPRLRFYTLRSPSTNAANNVGHASRRQLGEKALTRTGNRIPSHATAGDDLVPGVLLILENHGGRVYADHRDPSLPTSVCQIRVTGIASLQRQQVDPLGVWARRWYTPAKKHSTIPVCRIHHGHDLVRTRIPWLVPPHRVRRSRRRTRKLLQGIQCLLQNSLHSSQVRGVITQIRFIRI